MIWPVCGLCESPEMFCGRCVVIVNADYFDRGDKIHMHKPVSQDGTVARLLHLAVPPKRKETVKLGNISVEETELARLFPVRPNL